jgi:hypothetical protein
LVREDTTPHLQDGDYICFQERPPQLGQRNTEEDSVRGLDGEEIGLFWEFTDRAMVSAIDKILWSLLKFYEGCCRWFCIEGLNGSNGQEVGMLGLVGVVHVGHGGCGCGLFGCTICKRGLKRGR